MKPKKKLQFGKKLQLSDAALQRPSFLSEHHSVHLELHWIFFFLPVHVCLEYAIRAR